jgi:hypothetical protein
MLRIDAHDLLGRPAPPQFSKPLCNGANRKQLWFAQARTDYASIRSDLSSLGLCRSACLRREARGHLNMTFSG